MQVAGEPVALVVDREPGVLLLGPEQVDVAAASAGCMPKIANAAAQIANVRPAGLDQPGTVWPSTSTATASTTGEQRRPTGSAGTSRRRTAT